MYVNSAVPYIKAQFDVFANLICGFEIARGANNNKRKLN